MDRTALGFTRRTFRYGQSTVGVGCSTWTNLFFLCLEKTKKNFDKISPQRGAGGMGCFLPKSF